MELFKLNLHQIEFEYNNSKTCGKLVEAYAKMKFFYWIFASFCIVTLTIFEVKAGKWSKLTQSRAFKINYESLFKTISFISL